MADPTPTTRADVVPYLLATLDRLIEVHAEVAMDTDEDRALQERVLSTYRSARDTAAALASIAPATDLSSVEATELTVYPSGAARDEDEIHHFVLRVCARGRGLYAVRDPRGFCLGTDDHFVYEPSPSNRSEDWTATHRFPLREALQRAMDLVDDQVVMGRTWAQWQDIRARQDAERVITGG